MTQSAFFLRDQEADISYKMPVSSSMAIYRGEVGYAELAGKIMQAVTALIYENGDIVWQNGSLWRFDSDGLVDQEYVRATADAVIEKAFDADPYDPAKDAEWKMRMRRADVNRDMMIQPENSELRERLEGYLSSGTKHPQIKTARVLTKIFLGPTNEC
jgi:hypothetical protein